MFHKDFLSIRIFSVYICFVFNIIRVDIHHFFLKTSFIFFRPLIFNVVSQIFVLLLKTTSFERFAIM